MREVINSVGIDIGTSTTQLIFSKLTIENMATSYTVPRISIVDTQVVYRSAIYFTPLDAESNIDSERVKTIVNDEYAKAGMKPENLHTGGRSSWTGATCTPGPTCAAGGSTIFPSDDPRSWAIRGADAPLLPRQFAPRPAGGLAGTGPVFPSSSPAILRRRVIMG